MVKRTFIGLFVLAALFALPVATAFAQEPPPVQPQPPQPDGSIVHEVQMGDTLFGIAIAYKVSIDQIRELNKITDNSAPLVIGQKIIIKLAPTPTIPPNATFVIVTSGPSPTTAPPTQAGTGTAIQAATATSTPVLPTATLAPTEIPPTPVPSVAPINNKASICVTAFTDANTNHWRDVDDKPLPGVDLTLVDAAGSQQKLTTTSEDSTCFPAVSAGTFSVLAVPPSGYGLTTAAQLEVEAKAGSKLMLQFGAAQGYAPATTEAGTPGPTSEPTKGPGSGTTGIVDTISGNSGLIVLGLALLVLVGGLGVYGLARR